MQVFSSIYGLFGRAAGCLSGLLSFAVLLPMVFTQDSPIMPSDKPGPTPFFRQVIANQESSEKELDHYERIMREQIRKPGAPPTDEAKTWRVFPTGPGFDKIPMTPEGKPLSPESYRSELEKLEKYLVWITQNGEGQREAYAKAEHKRKERFDLLEATYQAFIFTRDGEEVRDGRTLLRYTIKPNPSYRATTRNAQIFKRVQGTVWIDEKTSQMAKIDGTVTDDISIALFLAKVYKGSHFMEERYEVAPDLWEPTFEQYDFDGRKFLSSFSIHERTFYSDYKRVGPPQEAVAVVRAELSKLQAQESAR